MQPKNFVSKIFHRSLLLVLVAFLPGIVTSVSAQTSCEFLTRGTTIPNSSGTPLVIDSSTGTVISANFFDSGAIDPPFFDGNEFVSVCIHHRDKNGFRTASISSDVGLDDDTRIKGYPEFIIGTKFGNQYETSFRYYANTGLPDEHKWPVTVSSLTSPNNNYQFANLHYISQVKGIGLPAFTNSLPEILVTLDIDEENVVGSERDVMLESWFYDTSANADLLGNDLATGLPITNTLNNIVGIGHPHYWELDNTLLEMMVHIGPLSPNDVSQATRNPGQNQLTETYSGKDTDNDGIDDHFDVDSHVNLNNNLDPQPGLYSSGIDNNQDGIDDADILPVTIGDFQYSIWYGESVLSPIVIYSRETNTSLQNDFDSSVPDMNLTTEGEITLNWNNFLDFTLNNVQQLLLNKADWASGPLSPFEKMSGSGGAIGGIELGVEPQINNPEDVPYTAHINKFDVTIDGNPFGLNSNSKCNGTQDISLIHGTKISDNFGWKWGGNNNKNVLIACFENTGIDLLFDVTGYDIDFEGEIELFVNDVSVGLLTSGLNNGFSASDTFTIPQSIQSSGENVIRFAQRTSGYKWGVTDLILYSTPSDCDGSEDFNLIANVTNSIEYGWKWGTDNNEERVVACFDSNGTDLNLSATGYDVDFTNEVTVLVNGISVGSFSTGPNNQRTDPQSFSIEKSLLRNKDNTLHFQQRTAGNKWGVTDFFLSKDSSNSIEITIGTIDNTHYGHNHGTNQNQNDVTLTFDGNADNLTLSATGFDIDFNREISIEINNNHIGYLLAGPNNQHTDQQTFAINKSLLEPFANTLTFKQSSSGNTWGISDILLAID